MFVISVSITATEAREPSNRVVLAVGTKGQVTGHFSLQGEIFSRTLHLPDDQGWCALWCSLFPEIPKEFGLDTDGDDMTDFEEMVLMQNPLIPDPLPRKLTPAEEAQRLENVRLARQNKAPRPLTADQARRIQEGLEVFIEARKNREGYRPSKAARLSAARALARDLRESDSEAGPGGRTTRRALLRARSMGVDRYAAQLIGADQLWPATAGATNGANGADPAPATGQPALPPLGLWDTGIVNVTGNSPPGGGTNSILGFGSGTNSRVSFGDNGTVNGGFVDHPTEMAKIMIWNSENNDPRGLAWQARIKSFDIIDDYPEMLEEATNQGMLFSNHSYSPEAGWRRPPSAQSGWEWWGPAGLAGEDPEFGAYSLNAKTIDGIIYRAQTYLPVWSAGNDATDHGIIDDSTGLIASGLPGYAYDIVSFADDGNGGVTQVRTNADPALFHPSDSGIPQGGAVRPETIEGPLENYGSGPIGMGLETIKSTGSAKNNLTVGAALSDASTVTNSENIWLGVVSSRGPTDDHRLKPDLVASGSFEFLGYASGRYGTTSEATATVTGLLGQLNEIRADGNGPTFLASTWKALLLNTTIDGRNLNHFVGDEFAETFTRVPTYLGDGGDGPGDPPVIGPSEADLIGPDPFFGYGMVQATAAADLLRQNLTSESGRAHLRQHLLYDPDPTGDNLTIEIPIEHDGSSPEIRVMLCWTDPPFQAATVEPLDTALFDPDVEQTPDTNARLVNDLDLRVIAPDHTVLMPWAPNFSSTQSILGPTPTGDNTRDNVEQIIISAPTSGTYLVRVTHKGTLKSWEKISGTSNYEMIPNQYQAFSLAVSGNLDPEPSGLALEVDFVDLQAGGDLVNLSFEAIIGLRYQLECSNDLTTWAAEGDPFHATQTNQPLTRFYPQQHETKRFYRLREITPFETP